VNFCVLHDLLMITFELVSPVQVIYYVHNA
jgi:hypothetical protein